VQGASTYRVYGEEGQGTEKVLLANVLKSERTVRVESASTVEEIVTGVNG